MFMVKSTPHKQADGRPRTPYYTRLIQRAKELGRDKKLPVKFPATWKGMLWHRAVQRLRAAIYRRGYVDGEEYSIRASEETGRVWLIYRGGRGEDE